MRAQAIRDRRLTPVAMLLAICLLLLGAAGTARAQSTISAIEVAGNQRIETSTVLNYAGLQAGTALTPGQINLAYQKILGSGLFETVEMDVKGGRLVITVKEYPTINKISIEGNKRIDDKVLQQIVTSKSQHVYSPSIAETDAGAIAEAYKQAGRLDATVTPKIIPRSQNRVDLVFQITEGKVIEVERIAFVGNHTFSDRRLRQVLATKQAGIFHTFVTSDTFIEDRVQLDSQRLNDFYRSRGYADFQILSVTPQFSRDRNAFFLTFNIREGQQFTIGKVSVSSEIKDVDPADFEDALRLRSGQTYSPVRIEDSTSRLERLIVKKGLDFVAINPKITRHERELILDVDYVLSRAPRIFIERIDIEGNSTTQDQVIRRQFNSVEGDPFNPVEIRQSAERIRNLGFFKTSEVNSKEGSSPDQAIIDVNVEEQPTGSINFGVNYSISNGFGVAFGISERNFLGRGQQANFSLGLGVDNSDSSISLTDPALLGRNLTGTSSLFYRTTNQDNSYFNTTSGGFVLGVTFPVSDNGRLGLTYTLQNDNIYDVSDDSSIIIQDEAGWLLSSEVGYNYSYDTRRRGLDPNTGLLFEFGQGFAGVGGDTNFINTTARVLGETKVFNEEIGLTFEVKGGALTMLNGEDSTILQRYRGGNVRGFKKNGIGPRDLTAVNQDTLGGNYGASLELQADFPIGLPDEYGIRGGVFYDIGSLWDLNNIQGTAGPVDDSMHLRSVVGLSFFWTSPLGPLRFDFSRALQKESYDDVQNFNFSISSRF